MAWQAGSEEGEAKVKVREEARGTTLMGTRNVTLVCVISTSFALVTRFITPLTYPLPDLNTPFLLVSLWT